MAPHPREADGSKPKTIEGLRLLPFTADLPIFDCGKCLNGDKKMNLIPQPIGVRRLQACGFLPRDPAVKRVFGVPLGVDFEPSCCPGYLTSLPEVVETRRLRPQWLKGTLALALRGKDVNEDLGPALDAQAIFDGSITQYQNWDMEERARKAKEQGNGQ